MTVDLAVVGGPFLDLVFDGLPEEPTSGREVVGRGLHVAPGGTAMQAIAAARSGASVALLAPRAQDAFGTTLADVLDAEGIRWVGPPAASTPVTAVLIGPDGTAMVTAPGASEPGAADVAAVAPRGVMVSLGRRGLAPEGSTVYVVSGQVELDSAASLRRVGHARALIVNGAEARTLSGERDAEAASRALAAVVEVAVVTVGEHGAVASTGGTTIHTPNPTVSTGDATGAGDVFAGAFAAADVRGAALSDALQHAVTMAGRAAAGATAYAGLGPRDA